MNVGAGYFVIKSQAMERLSWNALGCPCELTLSGGNRAGTLLKCAQEWVACFESRYSRFIESSLVGQINARAGTGEWVEVDAECEALFELCDSLNFITRGVLDPTMGPLIRLYYKASKFPEASEIEAAMRIIGWQRVERASGRVRLPAGMSLDLGGFGKEYAVDRVAEIFEAGGVESYLINFGNDVRVLGQPEGRPCWQIGVEDPNVLDTAVTAIGLTRGAVAASGNYRRFIEHKGKRFGHIIDPRTGYPVANGVRAVHIIADSCLEAGVHSTSAFILGAVEGLELIETAYGLEGIIIGEEASYRSQGFTDYEIR